METLTLMNYYVYCKEAARVSWRSGTHSLLVSNANATFNSPDKAGTGQQMPMQNVPG